MGAQKSNFKTGLKAIAGNDSVGAENENKVYTTTKLQTLIFYSDIPSSVKTGSAHEPAAHQLFRTNGDLAIYIDSAQNNKETVILLAYNHDIHLWQTRRKKVRKTFEIVIALERF